MKKMVDEARSKGAQVDHLLHVVVFDTKCPVRDHVAGVGNRCVGECLANDRHRHAVHFTDNVRFENLVTKVAGVHVLSQELNVTCKVFFDNFSHALCTESELPVRCHQVNP